jgi:predicted permease
MTGLLTDLRYVLRVLRRSPGFAVVAILSLTLGIGATTALYSAVTALLIDPIPVPAPKELAIVYWNREAEFSITQMNSGSYTDPASGTSYRTNFSYPLYQSMREASPDAQLFAFTFLRGVSVAAGDGPPVVAGALLADGRYFGVLRPGMALGRPLTDADDVQGGPVVAVLSHRFWSRVFGRDPSVLGRTIRVNGVSAEIVGVTAAGFDGLSRGGFFPITDVTFPLSAQPVIHPRWAPENESLFTSDRVFWLRVMARVPDAGNHNAVVSALTAAFRSTPSVVNDGQGPPASLVLGPGAQGAQPVRSDTARLLWILMGVVGAVLLIACVNLASMMLARGVAREREIAVRRALGSGRSRLVGQTLLEGLVLSLAGTAGGLLLMITGNDVLASFLTNGVSASAFGQIVVSPSINPGILGISLGLCILATLIFGLLPALRLSALDPAAFLKHRTAGGGPRLKLGRALIALQIALSIPLLVGAALFLRTVSNLGAVELGFQPNGLVIFQLDPAYTQRPAERWPDLYVEVLQRLEAIPGVRSATLIENPLMSGITSNAQVTIDGRDHNLYMNAVGPAFIETLEMRLVAGRMPGIQDGPNSVPVGALNETAARELFGNVSPIGRTIRIGRTDVLVVGVVSDTRYERQRAPVRPTLYPSALQRDGYGGHNVVLRTVEPLARLEPAIRRAVADVEPDLPIPDIRTQVAQIARTTARERVFTQILVIFGAFALLLASIGLHGVTSYAVSRRTSEIGVRVALGARPGEVLWLILRQVVFLAIAGLALGIPAALATGPLIGSLLFGVAPNDVSTITVTAAIMVVVALSAGALPAWRAARLDALVALRTE